MLQKIYQSQRKAFESKPYLSYAQRKKNLQSLKRALLSYKEKLAQAIYEDFGCRSKNETYIAEILPLLDEINHTLRHLKSWMKPSSRHIGLLHQMGKGKVFYQPLGVVGIVVPWNYPLFLSLGPLLAALSAGNHAMLKMSRNTGKTKSVLKEMLLSIYSEDYVAVLGSEDDPEYTFPKLPFDHLLFTGSAATGKRVMQAAAENLTPITLELGGKSPVLLHEDFPLAEAARRLVFGKTMNSGQTCVAPDYILCPKEKVEELAHLIRETFQKYFPTVADNSDYTSIINAHEYDKMVHFLEDAEKKGAKIFACSPESLESMALKHKMPLHVVTHCNENMLILQEEIFGPLLPILPYEKIADALEYIRKRPRPLAFYYFDTNAKRIEEVIYSIHAGGMAVNDTIIHVAQADLPFGGIGMSGLGQYHAHEGFLTFSKAKSVFLRPTFFNSSQYIYPPYGNWFQSMVYKYFIR